MLNRKSLESVRKAARFRLRSGDNTNRGPARYIPSEIELIAHATRISAVCREENQTGPVSNLRHERKNTGKLCLIMSTFDHDSCSKLAVE